MHSVVSHVDGYLKVWVFVETKKANNYPWHPGFWYYWIFALKHRDQVANEPELRFRMMIKDHVKIRFTSKLIFHLFCKAHVYYHNLLPVVCINSIPSISPHNSLIYLGISCQHCRGQPISPTKYQCTEPITDSCDLYPEAKYDIWHQI